MTKVAPASASVKENNARVAEGLVEVKVSTFKAGFGQLFLLALGIVLSGFTSSWNQGYQYGFLSCLTSNIVMSVGYVALVLCLSEMTSITNFSGGTYGFSRCSLGPVYGFVFGASEILQNNFFTVSNVDAIATAITIGFDAPYALEPVWVLGCYLLLLVIHMRGGPFFWYSMIPLAVYTLLLLCFYFATVMGLSSHLYDIPLQQREHPGFVGGGRGFMSALPYAAWFYVGVECIIVTGSKISNGTEMLPKVMLATISVLVTLCFLSVTVVYFSLSPDLPMSILFNNDFPLSLGFKHHLFIPEHAGALLVIPALFAAASGFLFTCKHSLHAMSLSGMVDPWFRPVYGPGSILWRALILSVCFQYAMYLLVHFVDAIPPGALFFMAMLGCCGAYTGCFMAFLTFKSRFPGMERGITVPGGQYVAYTGIAVFALVFISILGYQPEEAIWVVPAYFLYMFGCIFYYYRVVEKRQFFSPEEQKKFMKAYILNANKMKKRAKAAGPSWYRSLFNKVTNSAVKVMRGKAHSQKICSLSSGGSDSNEQSSSATKSAGFKSNHNANAHLGHKVAPNVILVMSSDDQNLTTPCPSKDDEVMPASTTLSPDEAVFATAEELAVNAYYYV